tara:strand:+ start:4960 stop:6057 length:1098 start_codon:yes stop_codon:yes gene_type:complete
MAEVGCLRDGHFNNLQVEGILVHDQNRVSDPSIEQGTMGTLVHHHDLNGNATTLASATDGDSFANAGMNLFRFSSGTQLFSFNIGGQTLAKPQKVAPGEFDISGDQTNDEGISYACQIPLGDGGDTEGETPGGGYAHDRDVLLADPQWASRNIDKQSFFARQEPYTVTFTVEITDVSGVDTCMFGVRKIYEVATSGDVAERGRKTPQRFRDVGTDYTDFACFDVVSGDIKTRHRLGGSVETNDVTQDASGRNGDFADTETWKFRIVVNRHGDVTWQAVSLDHGGHLPKTLTGAPTEFKLASGEYTPFIHIIQTADFSPVILHSLDISKNPQGPTTEVVGDKASNGCGGVVRYTHRDELADTHRHH